MIDKSSSGIARLLETCCEIESSTAKLYRLFAVLHEHEPVVAALWLKTAEEEDNHGRQFELGQRLSSGVISAAALDHEKADCVLRQLNDALAKVETSPPGIESALKFAVDLETRLSEFHMDTAVVFVDDSHRAMFKSMMSFDREHVQTLKDFLAEYTSR